MFLPAAPPQHILPNKVSPKYHNRNMSAHTSAIMPLRPMFHRLTQSLPRYQIPKTLRQHTASNHRAFTTSPRMSSSSSAITDKSRILEKPARFNPPSHGSRRVRPRAYPGPRLSEAEVEQQRTKRYPNMMPPEGSFMFRVLTNRSLHLWITLVSFCRVFSCTKGFVVGVREKGLLIHVLRSSQPSHP